MNRTSKLYLCALLKHAHTVNVAVHDPPSLLLFFLHLGNHSENELVELLFVFQ